MHGALSLVCFSCFLLLGVGSVCFFLSEVAGVDLLILFKN